MSESSRDLLSSDFTAKRGVSLSLSLSLEGTYFQENNSIASWAAGLCPSRATKGYIANYLSCRAGVRVHHPADTNEYIAIRINMLVARRCRLIIKL